MKNAKSTVAADLTSVRPRRWHRSRAEREAVRLESAALFREGLSHSMISRRLGVTRKAVIDWHKQFDAEGVEGLRYKPVKTPRLSNAQCDAVKEALVAGPEAQGYRTELWTLSRVAALIERQTGVHYSEGHVCKLLHDRLGFTSQKPECQAKERDEEAISRWKEETWPAIKKGRKNRTPV